MEECHSWPQTFWTCVALALAGFVVLVTGSSWNSFYAGVILTLPFLIWSLPVVLLLIAFWPIAMFYMLCDLVGWIRHRP